VPDVSNFTGMTVLQTVTTDPILYHGDLPSNLDLGPVVAVDTETMGLLPSRDRLCIVQLSSGDGIAHLVQFRKHYQAPNLVRLLADSKVTKLFHFARFDLAILQTWLGVTCLPIYCTKVASRLARTFTDRHSLKDLCKDLLNIDLSKHQQSSDWGAEVLSSEQLRYAAGDVLHLHALKAKLDVILEREQRTSLAEACFAFLPTRVVLDLSGWLDVDIFAH
jgi:ribonuclease D